MLRPVAHHELLTLMQSDKLKTITLLAWSTNEVNNIFKHHVKEGNLIEMAALLISAHECVMAPSTLQNKDGLAINGNMAYLQCIKESMWLETIEKMESLGRLRTMSKPAWKRRAKFMALESALYLLKLFERVGVAIRSYIGSQPSNVSCNAFLISFVHYSYDFRFLKS